MKLHKLSDAQRRLAEDNHNLVFQYLRMRGLDTDEYYDTVIFRYLLAVQQYDENPQLRQYSFKAIAFGGMRSALYNHFRSRRRQRQNAVVYSFDALQVSEAGLPADTRSNTPAPYEYMAAREQWGAIQPTITPKQMQALEMRADGYTCREIGELYRLVPSSVSGRICRLRKKVREAA